MGERETNRCFTVSLRVLEPAPPKHMPFLALEGVKGLLESKTSRCPTVPDTPPKLLPAFFFPFCNKSVISHGTEEPAACL